MKIRVGFGFDVHQLVAGRELWLGGIRLGHEKGLLGHSDADVLIHTICDALLGAANMRDIGYHFPEPSSLPVKPSFSVVVALMEMSSSSMPITVASVRCISGICAFSLGRSAQTVASMLLTE